MLVLMFTIFTIAVKGAVMLSRRTSCILFVTYCYFTIIDAKTQLFIQGFVPRDNPTFVVTSLEPAAHLAVEDINNSTEYLTNYTLNLAFVDTKCDPAEATWQLIRSVIRRENDTGRVVMLLGGGCSPATEPLAALAGLFYNLTQVSYSSTSPSLSDRTKYNRFFRTIPYEVFVSRARYAMMKQYNWRKVALLYETQTIYATAVQEFINSVNETGLQDITLLVRSFTRDPNIHLQRIKSQDYRIVFAWFYEEKGLITFCEAIKLGLVSSDHVWVMPAFDKDWWKRSKSYNDCTVQQMRDALPYVLFVDSFPWDPNPTAESISGRNRENFNTTYFSRLNSSHSSTSQYNDVGHLYASFAYDAVWAIALALNATIANGTAVEDFDYNNEEIADQLKIAMENVKFRGVSGDVSFSNGERVGHTAIYQYRNCDCTREHCSSDDDLLYELVALNNQSDRELGIKLENNYTEACIWWNREDGNPPKDRRTPVYEHLDHGVIHTCFVLVPCALLFLSFLLLFNIFTIRKPLIANSAPHMNNVILGGTILMVLTTLSLSFDSDYPRSFMLRGSNATVAMETKDRYSSWCKARLWLLAIGFTLSFGSLFSKMWQIYRLYTNPKLKNQPLSLWNFFIPLGVFLFLDIAVLIPWTVLFPLEWHEEVKISDDGNTEIHYEYCSCDKFGYWIGAIYVYKGLLVVFSLFLAYESRNVKSYYVNDSRYVIISLLTAVLLIGSGAPVSLVLSLFFIPDGAYIVAVLCIILACVCSTGILFIPKMIWMYQGKSTFITGSVPPDDNTTQDENYRSSSSDNKSSDTGQEMSSLRKKDREQGGSTVKELNDTTEAIVSNDRRGSNNTESDSGVQTDELAYQCKASL